MIESCENCGGLHYGTPRGECPYPKREGPLVKLLEEVLTADPKQPATCPTCNRDIRRGVMRATCADPWHDDQPPAQESEVDKLAQVLRDYITITGAMGLGNSFAVHDATQALIALADLAKRERESRVGMMNAQEIRAASIRKLTQERDEARRLHDEHCTGLYCEGGLAPWRGRDDA